MIPRARFRAPLLLALAVGSAAWAGPIARHGSTNNVTDWCGTSNVVGGGRWSYLEGDPTAVTPVLLAEQYSGTVNGRAYTGSDNWCDDKNNSLNVYVVTDSGEIRTDETDLIFNYTIDDANTVDPCEGGWVRIHGSYSGTGTARLRIFQTIDTSGGTIDPTGMITLYDETASEHSFDITVEVQPGNDILCDGDNHEAWWWTQVLDVTIEATTAPETTITVLDPGAGAVLRSGEFCTIRWNTEGQWLERVLLEYSSDNGGHYSPIAEVANSGGYDWPVPAALSDQCLIRVSAVELPGVSDVTDGTFTIIDDLYFGDVTGDGFVALDDFAALAQQWQQCDDPAGCN